jgi:cobalt-zinc-cadmium efflux system outer membrane protein
MRAFSRVCSQILASYSNCAGFPLARQSIRSTEEFDAKVRNDRTDSTPNGIHNERNDISASMDAGRQASLPNLIHLMRTDAMKKLTFPITMTCLVAISGCAGVNGLSRHSTDRSNAGGASQAARSSPIASADDASLPAEPAVSSVAFVDQGGGIDHPGNVARVNVDRVDIDRMNIGGNFANGFFSQTDDRKIAADGQTQADSKSLLEPVVTEPLARFEWISSPVDADVDGANVDGYSLADIEAMALGSNPSIQSARATARKAAGLRAQVGTRPNPTLGYFGQQIADRNTDQHGVFVEQEFVRGNKLALNREVLGHTQRAQTAEIETQRYRVLTDVRVRFYEAIAAQQQVDATRTFAGVALRGVEVAEQRQEAEEGTLIETLQARTLLSEVTLAAEQAEVAYRGAWKDLAAIAGLQAATPARLVADLDTPVATPDWEAAYNEIVSQSPEMTVAQAIVCEKQALLRRQQVQPIPNVTAQMGAGYDEATDHGMINLQLSAPIPAWNKNSGNISAAYSDFVRATQEVQRIQQSIRSRLARAAQEFESSARSVRKYEDEIIPQAKKSLDLSEEAYRAGELEFLQVLIVRRSYYESSIRLIQARGSLAQAASRVDGLLLTGGLDSPMDYTNGDGIRGASLGGQ